jgi:lysophospholipase L1-like esterase
MPAISRHSERVLSPLKKRVFLGLTIASPLVFIVLLELALRLLHVGPDLSLFTTETIRGKAYYVMNPSVGARYFSGPSFAPAPSTEYFRVPKPAGTFRIFCLGGSTVVGYPYWHNASFSSFLRERLRRIFPGRDFEVINLGMTAINSYTVLDFVRELPAYDPDLIIVYDGHNEFYGALGAGSIGKVSHFRSWVLAYLRLLHFRTVLLLREGYAWLRDVIRGEGGPAGGRGPTLELLAGRQLIPIHSPMYEDTRRTFELNLKDICSVAHEHHIPILLSTQVSNLRNIPPFSSEAPTWLTAEAKGSFDHHLDLASKAIRDQHWAAALTQLQAALAIDSSHAWTQFAAATCLDFLGRTHEARIDYIKARDDDQLRFRTSTDFNRVIAEMKDTTTVGVVDMEHVFMANSPDSLIGNSLIMDHLHPNSFGHFLMGKAYAEAMRQRGFLASPDVWASHDTIPDSLLWADRPVAEIDERIAARRTQILLSSWPFVAQDTTVPPVSPQDTLGRIAEGVVDGTSGWGNAHYEAISFYTERHDWPDLEREYRTLINLVPLEVTPYLKLGRLYMQQRQFKEAGTLFQISITVEPTAIAYRNLGDIALRDSSVDEAISLYLKTRAFRQSPEEEVQNGFVLAVAYLRANMVDPAESQLLHVLSIDPKHKPSLELLKVIRLAKKKHP